MGYGLLVIEVLGLELVIGDTVRVLFSTALAVACLWPDADDVPVFWGDGPGRGVRGAGIISGRGDWLVRRETGKCFGRI